MRKFGLFKIVISYFIVINSISFSQVFNNGNFESWTAGSPDNWTLTPVGSNISFSQSSLNEGKGGTGYALKIIANSNTGTGYDGQMEAMITDITAGSDYTISIWTKSTGGSNKVWVRFWDTRWFDSGDIQVGSDLDQGNFSSGDNTDWLEYSTSTLTAPTGAVKLRVNFRIYVQTGFTSGDFIWIDDLSVNGTVLPVELTSFSASIVNNGIRLNWRTETEVNNYGFEIERIMPNDLMTNDENSQPSLVTGHWVAIGFVEGHGNSNSPKEYSYIDDKVTSGKYAYRLKQIDNDGTYEFSKVIEIDVDAPLGYELSQNYPNPFNPATTIKFSLPVTSNVRLSVFNILGEEVQILLNETKEAGVYTIDFNASQLDSGMYIYRIQAGDFILVKKMTLLK